MDIESRKKLIESLETFLNNNAEVFNSVISALNWTGDSLLDEFKMQCPHDPHHWVPESSLPKHLESCSWIKEGYCKEDFSKQPPDSDFFYEKASSVVSVTVDKKKQASILMGNGLLNTDAQDFESKGLPRTIDRQCAELNLEQRLTIYDYAVEESKKSKQANEIALEELMVDFEKKEDEDKPKTELQLLAEQRDYKRRRQSYRAKNVHITKKSYTEVMKEVIGNQMSYLAETRKLEAAENSESATELSTNNERSEDRKSRHEHKSRKYESDRYLYEERSPSRSPKKRKHKRSRSRSRSRQKHKKSHKHRKSYK